MKKVFFWVRIFCLFTFLKKLKRDFSEILSSILESGSKQVCKISSKSTEPFSQKPLLLLAAHSIPNKLPTFNGDRSILNTTRGGFAAPGRSGGSATLQAAPQGSKRCPDLPHHTPPLLLLLDNFFLQFYFSTLSCTINNFLSHFISPPLFCTRCIYI